MWYLSALESLSYELVQLVAEVLGLALDGLAQFYDAPECMQHRSKVPICKCSRRSSFVGLIFRFYLPRSSRPDPRPAHV